MIEAFGVLITLVLVLFFAIAALAGIGFILLVLYGIVLLPVVLYRKIR